MRVILVVYWHPWSTGTGEARRQLQAMKALVGEQTQTPEWAEIHLCKAPDGYFGKCPQNHVTGCYETARLSPFGPTRPFVHDLIDLAHSCSREPQTWIGFMQSDILLRSEFWDRLSKLDSDFEMLVGHRRELGGEHTELCSPNIDLVMFRTEIWPYVKPYYPDFVLTDSWWNSCILGLQDRMRLRCARFKNSELLHFEHLTAEGKDSNVYNTNLIERFDRGGGLIKPTERTARDTR